MQINKDRRSAQSSFSWINLEVRNIVIILGVYKNESQRTGSLKLNVGDDISLGYRGEKRLLMFRMGDIAEYIHIDKNYSGNYKFFVKIYGLQV